jgi:hypothetical protein
MLLFGARAFASKSLFDFTFQLMAGKENTLRERADGATDPSAFLFGIGSLV